MLLMPLLHLAMQAMVPPPAVIERPLDIQEAIRPPVPPAPGSAGPQLLNFEEVFNSDNYPFWALENWDEGVVRFRIDVDATGRATGCRIVAPSGVPTLDQPTCDLLLAKARFAPATDRRRKPMAGNYSRVVRWQTEQLAPWRVADRSQRIILSVDAGSKPQCRLEQLPGDDDDPRTCEFYVASPQVVIALARQLVAYQGSRERWEMVWHNGWFVPGGPAGEGESIGSHPGETLFERTRARLTIDAAGKVTGCFPVERGTASNAEWVKACTVMKQSRFEPAASAGAKERTLVQVVAIYVREK
ncbi:MAG: TonB family protein [Sphingomicrobium sp.]